MPGANFAKSENSGGDIGGDKKLTLAQRRAALLLACEYDRLRVRLASAQVDAEKKILRTRPGASAMASAFFEHFPPLVLLRMGALLLPKKQRSMLLLAGALRRLLGGRKKHWAK